MSAHRSPVSHRYLPGLDGLRTIAVLSVMAYHLNLPFASGGLLGVEVFFVLSGYLITDLLLTEWSQTGHISLKRFWQRRARRLMPALAVMLIGVLLFMWITGAPQLSSAWADVIAACLYVSNWWYIFHHVSYFASFGPPPPFTHLWSLAVEEQFYLLWPLVVLVLCRIIRPTWMRVSFILLGIVLSAGTMAILFHPGIDPSRVYYGTDTRSFGLLVGALAAVLFPSSGPWKRDRRSSLVLDVAGLLSLGLILWMVGQTNEYEPFLYRDGLLTLSVASAVVIVSLAQPNSGLGNIIGCNALRWLGVRSYAIYLWHYPVIALTTPVVNASGIVLWRDALQVCASILLADLSYRFVELPIRHGQFKLSLRWIRRSSAWPLSRGPRIGTKIWIGLSGAIVAVFGLSAAGTVLPTITATASDSFAPPSTLVSAATTQELPKGTAAPGSGSKRKTNLKQRTTKKYGTPAKTVSTHTFLGQGVTAIGDSVLIDAKPYLEAMWPRSVIDGEVGRQWYEAPAEIARLRKNGKLGNRMIIELGTNGPFTQDQMLSILKSLGKDEQIILVNTRVPRPWQGVVNQTLTHFAKTYPHTTLVNWYAASAGHDNYFYPDGVHLNPTGAEAYAKLVAKAVAKEVRSSKR